MTSVTFVIIQCFTNTPNQYIYIGIQKGYLQNISSKIVHEPVSRPYTLTFHTSQIWHITMMISSQLKLYVPPKDSLLLEIFPHHNTVHNTTQTPNSLMEAFQHLPPSLQEIVGTPNFPLITVSNCWVTYKNQTYLYLVPVMLHLNWREQLMHGFYLQEM